MTPLNTQHTQINGTRFAMTNCATTNRGMTSLDVSTNGGRKGIAYDWQSLLAADGVTAIEAKLSELVLESAE